MLRIDKFKNQQLKGEILLPASKSLSHRYLIIHAMGAADLEIKNLSNSNDTMILQNALKSAESIIDFEDAGTPMRFFLAYAALKNMHITITGNDGLKTRPIGPLVNALSQLGCRIKYLENEGFVPVRIENGIDITKNKVVVDATISSQFISALLLVAPGLANGLIIELKGKAASMPYIGLTIDCMKQAGVDVKLDDQLIHVPAKKYHLTNEITIEADWSAAAFIYALVAVSKNSNIILTGLDLNSLQGDRITAFLFELFGVQTTVENNNIRLSNSSIVVPKIKIDFTAIPDMFPVIAVTCASLRINATFTGIKNLALKESNRLLAIKENLEQTGASLNIEDGQIATLTYTERKDEEYHFKSFNDHRIVMAFSIFALHKDIIIDDETVVKKSFPQYWEIFKRLDIIKS